MTDSCSGRHLQSNYRNKFYQVYRGVVIANNINIMIQNKSKSNENKLDINFKNVQYFFLYFNFFLYFLYFSPDLRYIT